MSTLSHKDYIATIELDLDAGIFHGRVINIRSVLTFHGRTVDELRDAFAETIAVYEEWCKERGKEPERPYSGHFTLRVPPDLHKRVASAAASSGKSLNGFIKEALEHVV
jgi:predicted HicB family RNase H-like nuclease